MSLSIIVLAAGKGSRMVSSRPKVLHEVGNYPMLFHVLDTATSLKNSNVNLVISKSLLAFKQEIKKRYPNIVFSLQEKQNGTADAVKCALKKNQIYSKKTIILYGDTPLISKGTLQKSLRSYDTKKLDLCVISMMPKQNKNFYGKLKFQKNRLVSIVEQVDNKERQSELDICNSGIMIINSKKLNENIQLVENSNNKNEFYLTDLVKVFSQQHFLVDHFSCVFEETLGVNNMTDLMLVNKEFQIKKRNYFLDKGVFMQDPDTVYFSSDTKIGINVKIQPNVYFGKSVIIKDGVTLRSFSYLDNVKVHENVIIGPFARIRDGVEIEQDSKVGNFVELKKSKIGKDVKISHLSYIGDSTIKNSCNIGAGAITCNYDGIKKHKTMIGENCFIGSNSSLVAPLKIKKGSLIGAGTVVNEDVPYGTVVYRKSKLIKKNKKK